MSIYKIITEKVLFMKQRIKNTMKFFDISSKQQMPIFIQLINTEAQFSWLFIMVVETVLLKKDSKQ